MILVTVPPPIPEVFFHAPFNAPLPPSSLPPSSRVHRRRFGASNVCPVCDRPKPSSAIGHHVSRSITGDCWISISSSFSLSFSLANSLSRTERERERRMANPPFRCDARIEGIISRPVVVIRNGFHFFSFFFRRFVEKFIFWKNWKNGNGKKKSVKRKVIVKLSFFSFS